MVYEAHRNVAAPRHQHYAEVRLEILEIEFVFESIDSTYESSEEMSNNESTREEESSCTGSHESQVTTIMAARNSGQYTEGG